MKFCKYCGKQIEEHVTQCPYCNKVFAARLWEESKGESASRNTFFPKLLFWLKKPVVWGSTAAAVAILILIIIFSGAGRCDYGSCDNKAVSGYRYCYSHKCAISDCDSAYYSSSNYCYYHSKLYDETESSSYVPSYKLKISNVTVYSSYYTYAEGTITNNSDTTVKFVKIKGSFKTSYGTVVDTDWTYAVGAEGLAPGESCKWKLSVDKDSSIKDCEISIIDYDY